MLFEPPACERGHDTDYGKAGSGEEKSECLVLAQKAKLFTEPEGVCREPLQAVPPCFHYISHITNVRVRASADKATWALRRRLFFTRMLPPH